nr:TolC family protein [candidate division Zixibacteria bacterium]
MSNRVQYSIRGIFYISIFSVFLISSQISSATVITLNEAVDIALNQTARGSMVRGNLEVAEQNYYARRVNFYLPEISINGSVPAYSVDESYRFFGGATEKRLYKTKDLGFNSFIELNQNLLTGGDLTITANLLASDNRYPNTRLDIPEGTFIQEETRRGYFTVSYTQPLLKPSDSKNNLKNTRDDFEIARFVKVEEEAALKKEVVESYMGVLQLNVKSEYYKSMYEAARLTAEIDSLKFLDGVISEEDWLLSASARLDAELNLHDINNQAEEMKRQLAIHLDRDVTQPLDPVEPDIIAHIKPEIREQMLNSWDESIPVQKAGLEYRRAKREADYKASGHGLTGDLTADYSTGQGNVKVDGVKDDINTRGWGVSLNFSYPIWDGGSSGAEVKAARLQADQARLEYNRARQSSRAEIINLINQLDVSYRRLDIMKKQIELAKSRLDIAESRFKDGQISEITYQESKAFYLESRDKYLEEYKAYLVERAEIEGKFLFK